MMIKPCLNQLFKNLLYPKRFRRDFPAKNMSGQASHRADLIQFIC